MACRIGFDRTSVDSLRGGSYSSGMGDTGASGNSVIVVDGLVAGDAPCRRCEYNLRTLSIDAVCPECAWPVAQSIQSEELRFADVRWLRQVRWGVRLLLVSVAGPLALFIASFVVFIIAATLFNSPIDIHLVDKWTDFGVFVFELVRLAFVVGVFLVTVAEPATFVSAKFRSVAWMARILALGDGIMNVTGFVLAMQGAVISWPLALLVLVPILKSGSFCFLTVGMRAIARRAGRARLASWTLGVVSVAFVLSVIHAFALFGNQWVLLSGALGPQSSVDPVIDWATFTCCVVGAVLLVHYNWLLTRAIADAEQRAKA